MAHITVPVTFAQTVQVAAPLDEVRAFLADFPQALALFPRTDTIELHDDDTLVWILDKLGPPPYQQQTVYPMRYGLDGDRIWWEPDLGLDAGPHADDLLTGSCTLKATPSGTEAHLDTTAELRIEVPFLAKKLAPPIVRVEFERLTEQFVENLKAELERKG